MKRIIFSLLAFTFFSSQAFAATGAEDYATPTPRNNKKPLPSIYDIKVKTENNGFFFKPFASIEYSAPVISGGGTNSEFKTSHNIFSQIRDIENIALGFNFRVHRYLGFNANWAQTDLDNTTLQNVGALGRKAGFRMDQYNFSALFYAPIVENLFELFAEAGVSDMTSKLTYARTDGTSFQNKAHETMGIYGVGFQVTPNEKSAIRFSVQKYSGKLALLDGHYTTVRIGYLHSF